MDLDIRQTGNICTLKVKGRFRSDRVPEFDAVVISASDSRKSASNAGRNNGSKRRSSCNKRVPESTNQFKTGLPVEAGGRSSALPLRCAQER